MEPRGCNRWRSVANRPVSKTRKQAKTVAVGCHQLRKTFHGNEGVAAVNELRGQPRLESVAIQETDTGPFCGPSLVELAGLEPATSSGALTQAVHRFA